MKLVSQDKHLNFSLKSLFALQHQLFPNLLTSGPLTLFTGCICVKVVTSSPKSDVPFSKWLEGKFDKLSILKNSFFPTYLIIWRTLRFLLWTCGGSWPPCWKPCLTPIKPNAFFSSNLLSFSVILHISVAVRGPPLVLCACCGIRCSSVEVTWRELLSPQ